MHIFKTINVEKSNSCITHNKLFVQLLCKTIVKERTNESIFKRHYTFFNPQVIFQVFLEYRQKNVSSNNIPYRKSKNNMKDTQTKLN